MPHKASKAKPKMSSYALSQKAAGHKLAAGNAVKKTNPKLAASLQKSAGYSLAAANAKAAGR